MTMVQSNISFIVNFKGKTTQAVNVDNLVVTSSIYSNGLNKVKFELPDSKAEEIAQAVNSTEASSVELILISF